MCLEQWNDSHSEGKMNGIDFSAISSTKMWMLFAWHQRNIHLMNVGPNELVASTIKMCTIGDGEPFFMPKVLVHTYFIIEVSFRFVQTYLHSSLTLIRSLSQLQNPNENGKLFKYLWFYHIFCSKICKKCEKNSFTKTLFCDGKSFHDGTEAEQSMAMQIKLKRHQNCKNLHFIWKDIFWHLRMGFEV